MEIVDGSTVTQCEYCGTKQTLPRLHDERIANLYDRANHFRRGNDYDRALGIYEQILSEDRSDSEAYWSIVLCRYGVEYVDDPATHSRIPIINRTQFASIFSDEDYKSAILYADDSQKAIYAKEAEKIEALQKRSLEISKSETPYDVFICYKETDRNGRRTLDSVLATEIYHELSQEGLKVFLSRITLEDKLGQEYEPYIFSALNSAKIMIALGTKPEHFHAVWVKNEWSRYLSLIKSGKKNTLIPAYRDMDPYDLPEEFSHLQALDMSKLGFMQDLSRGIKKILSANNTESAPPHMATTSTSVETAIDYALILIEDGDVQKATQILDDTVQIAPKHPMIYVAKLMIEYGVQKVEQLGELKLGFESSSNYQKALRFSSPQLKSALENYCQQAKSNNLNTIYTKALQMTESEASITKLENARTLFNTIADYCDAKERADECTARIEQIKNEEVYRAAEERMKIGAKIPRNIPALNRAAEYFLSIEAYKDSAEKADACARIIYDEQKRLANIKLRRKRVGLIVASSLTAVIAGVAAYFLYIFPQGKYIEAEQLFEKASYSEAYELYQGIGYYKDSAEKAKECLYAQATGLRQEKKWEKANKLFEQLENYKDSAQLIHNHAFKTIKVQKATCEADGYEIYRCKECEGTYRKDLKASGHKYQAATCTSPKKCQKCGKTQGKALGHSSDSAKCSRCGKINFKTITYSGKGSTVKNINLPKGSFRFTCTKTSGEHGFVDIDLNDGTSNYPESLLFESDIGASEVTVVSGPIKNGALTINANSNYYGASGWKVVIEAIG